MLELVSRVRIYFDCVTFPGVNMARHNAEPTASLPFQQHPSLNHTNKQWPGEPAVR